MPSRNIIKCHQYLQDRWPLLKARYEKDNPGYELRLVATYRPIAEQQKLYQQGRTTIGPKVTDIDGIRRRSFHNYDPARAFDVGVFKDGVYITDVKKYSFSRYAKELKLVWGGTWISRPDAPHFEMPKGAVA